MPQVRVRSFDANLSLMCPSHKIGTAASTSLRPLRLFSAHSGQTNFDPPDLVFKEDTTKLFDAAGNPVSKFN